MRLPRARNLALIGDRGVGKGALKTRFTLQFFNTEVDVPTICDDSYRKQTVVDDCIYLLRIEKNWPTTDSSEAYDNWSARGFESYEIGRAHGFLLVYNVAERSSFDHIEQHYKDICRVRATSFTHSTSQRRSMTKIPLVLVGNQCDRDPKVSTYEGQSLARKLGCEFLETSAKTGKNVEKAPHDLARILEPGRGDLA